MRTSQQDGILGWAKEHPRLADICCLLLIVLFAVFIRAVYVAEYAMTPLGVTAVGADVAEYDALARHLLVGGADSSGGAIHAPLYPRFLAMLYRWVGPVLPAVRNLQCLLDVLAMSLVWIAVRRVWRLRVACLTGLIWATYLPLVYYSAELYAEGLVVFLLAASFFLWSFVPAARRLRPALLLGIGLCLGLAAVTHPLSLLFGLAATALGPLLALPELERRGKWLAVVWLALGLLIPLGIVSWRSSRAAGGPVLVQDRAGFNFYLGNNPDADGTPYVPPGPEYDHLLAWPAREGVEGGHAAQAFFCRQALGFALHHPLRELGLLVRKAVLTWNAHEIASGSDLPELQLFTPLMRLPFPRFLWIAPLAILGFWLHRRDRRVWLWALLPAAYTVALTIFLTCGRYRLPMVPALIVLAALGLDALATAFRQQDVTTWRVATAIILLAVLPVYLVRPPVPRDSTARSWLLIAEANWRLYTLANGDERVRESHLAGAEKTVAEAAKLAPNLPGIHHLRGLCLSARGESQQALAELALARALRPRDPQVLVNYALTLAENGQPQAARELIEQALQVSPNQASLWYELGVFAAADNDLAQAQDAYRRTLALDPTQVSALLNLAILHYRAADTDTAAALYRRALLLDPRKARAHFGLAVLLAEQGQAPAAYPHFEAAVANEPGNPTFWAVYEQVLADAGEAERARLVAERGQRATAPPIPEPQAEKP